jgi:hypothetical protein
VKRRFHVRFKVTVRLLKSVARIRLAKTENPSSYVEVKCKVCRPALALLIPSSSELCE